MWIKFVEINIVLHRMFSNLCYIIFIKLLKHYRFYFLYITNKFSFKFFWKTTLIRFMSWTSTDWLSLLKGQFKNLTTGKGLGKLNNVWLERSKLHFEIPCNLTQPIENYSVKNVSFCEISIKKLYWKKLLVCQYIKYIIECFSPRLFSTKLLL